MLYLIFEKGILNFDFFFLKFSFRMEEIRDSDPIKKSKILYRESQIS